MNSKCAKYSYRLLSVGIEEQSRNALVEVLLPKFRVMNTINLIKLTDTLSVDELMAVVGGKEEDKEIQISCQSEAVKCVTGA